MFYWHGKKATKPILIKVWNQGGFEIVPTQASFAKTFTVFD